MKGPRKVMHHQEVFQGEPDSQQGQRLEGRDGIEGGI